MPDIVSGIFIWTGGGIGRRWWP